jgi:hypothetical protein
MYRFAIMLVLLLITAESAAAQPVRSGDQVRLRGAGVQGQFTVEGTTSDMLMVRDTAGVQSSIPLESLQKLKVLRGRRSGGRGFLRGAGFGLGVGAVTGGIIGFASGSDAPGILSFTASEKAAMMGIVLGGGGVVVGGLVGALAPGDDWERIQLGPSRGPSGAVWTVGYTHRF